MSFDQDPKAEQEASPTPDPHSLVQTQAPKFKKSLARRVIQKIQPSKLKQVVSSHLSQKRNKQLAKRTARKLSETASLSQTQTTSEGPKQKQFLMTGAKTKAKATSQLQNKAKVATKKKSILGKRPTAAAKPRARVGLLA